MHRYQHHIGDYAAATAHLSWDEDQAYTRLLRAYYHHERPIPNDLKEACRLVRAETKAHKQAVERVLREFFEQTPDGWRQKRCDEEIELAHENGEEAKAKNENERERKKRYRARRSEIFAELRKHDIIPKWDTPIDELETLLERACHAPVTSDKPSPKTGQGRSKDAPRTRTGASPETGQGQNGHGYPLPITQYPLPITQEPEREETPRAKRFGLDTLPPEWAEFCSRERPDLNPQKTFEKFVDHWRAKPGKDGTKLDWFATWRNWVRGEKSQGGSNASNQRNFAKPDEFDGLIG